jgi:hypothetical protein
MINIRYHIVSITAVFLALGIGAALGSTFLDRYTVNRIDTNVRSAETRIRETRAKNADLTKDIARSQAREAGLIADPAGVLFANQLTNVPVLLITSPGVDQDLVTNLTGVLVGAGADVRGTLELRDQLRFQGSSVDDKVAAEVGTKASDVSGTSRAVFRKLQIALETAGQPVPRDQQPNGSTTVPGSPTTVAPTTAPPAPGVVPATSTPASPNPTTAVGAVTNQPSIVSTLLAAGYLRLTPGTGHEAADPILEAPGYRYVLVTASGLDRGDTNAMLRLLPSSGSAAALPAVVVSGTDPTIDPTKDASKKVEPSAVTDVRRSAALASRYDTVDDLDTLAGMASTVTVLRDIGTVPAGHYGQGQGATALLPPRR